MHAIDVEQFRSRAKYFFQQLNQEVDKNMCAVIGSRPIPPLLILRGKGDANANTTSHTTALHLWFLGAEFPETAILLMKPNRILFIASPKKIGVLEILKPGSEDLDLQFVVRDDNAYKTIYEWVPSKTLGHLPDDELDGQWASGFKDQLDDYAFEDCSSFVALLLGTKDEKEKISLRKSAQVAGLALEELLIRNQVENVIAENISKTHADISAEVLKEADSEDNLKLWENLHKYDPDSLDLVYCSVMSKSGGYELSVPNVPTDDNLAQNGAIVCTVGVKYADYTTILTRTLLINPSQEQERCYKCLVVLTDRILKYLKVGAIYGEVYNLAHKSIPANIQGRFLDSIGFAIGLNERDEKLEIKADNHLPILKNTTLCLSLGFRATDDENWAIWLTDSVIVTENGPEVLTAHVDKALTNISYDLDDGEDDKKETPKSQKRGRQTAHRGPVPSGTQQGEKRGPMPAPFISVSETRQLRNLPSRQQAAAAGASAGGPPDDANPRRSARTVQTVENQNNMIALEERQPVWKAAKHKELGARFQNGYSLEVVAKATEKYNFKAYSSTKEYPNIPNNQVYFDCKMNCLIVPLHGQMLPFHANIVKNIVSAPRGNVQFFRINFITPGGGGAIIEEFPEGGNGRVFLKELTIRCTSKTACHMSTVTRQLKDAQNLIKSQDAKLKNADTPQMPLQMQGGSRPCLRDIHMRPQIGPRAKAAGRLDCHGNGFRFISPKGETLDVLFSNIKHAIFQKCDGKNPFALLHFELKNHITHARKPWSGIQFLTEVIGAEDLMDKKGINSYDAGEEREDMLQAQRISTMNAAFKHFCKQVEEVTRNSLFPIHFDAPFTKLGFSGNPIRSLVNCYPTRDCLVALQEWPAFLLTLKDVEFVCFERYSMQLMEFDLLFVLKNYEKAPIKICAVRRADIDKIKQWLAELKMVWYHSQVPLNWTKVLKEVIKNIQQNKFIQSGGWDAWFNIEDDASDKGDSDDQSAYESEKESSEDAYQPSADEATESDSHMSDSDSESGLSWDELEDRAKRADKKRDEGPMAPKSVSKRRRR